MQNKLSMEIAAKKFLVIGGGGFVGKALCLKLKELGAEVISLSRSDYPELRAAGITCLQHDIEQSFDSISQELSGIDGVFHTASKVDMWGAYEDFYRTNVVGTKNVIESCRKNGIKYLIYTSSPSVIADGKDTSGVDESYPYPDSYMANYPATKAMAEKLIRSANVSGLYTIALRPHLIWGPGDRHLLPTILERAKAGRLPQIGAGNNLVDTSYIDDCVQAHVLAMSSLMKNKDLGGRVYFISQGEPVKLWGWIETILAMNNIEPIKKRVPKWLGMMIATILEGVSNFVTKKEPLLTRFLISQMSCSHYFDISNAKRDLGYEPKFTVDQGLIATFRS